MTAEEYVVEELKENKKSNAKMLIEFVKLSNELETLKENINNIKNLFTIKETEESRYISMTSAWEKYEPTLFEKLVKLFDLEVNEK